MTTTSSETPSASLELGISSNETSLDEKKLVAWVNEAFTKMKNARSKSERAWYLNLAFYFGQQNVVFKDNRNVSQNFTLYTPPAPGS